MALDYPQNHFSAQYLENDLMERDKTFAYSLTFTRSKLGLFGINFLKYTRLLWPLVIARILFPFNIL